MNDLTKKEPAYDPQDLERLLVARENAGDVSGMTALFEPDAVIEPGDGQVVRGKEAIHDFFCETPGYWVWTGRTTLRTRRSATSPHLR